MTVTDSPTAGAAAAVSGATPLVDVALVRDFAPGGGLPAGAATVEPPAGDWISADVPGDVHRALVAAGRLDEPFYDRNELDARWVEEREWWYRMSFPAVRAPAADERLVLVLHGLDTFATVYLNGAELGRSRNMFRPAVFDVGGRVSDGEENVLAVRFDPPRAHAGPPLEGQWAPNDHDRVWMRKAQFGFGWDWGPRLPTIGAWRPVELRRRRIAAIAGVRFSTLEIRDGEALVEVAVEAERFAGEPALVAAIELRAPGDGPALGARTPLRGDGATVRSATRLILRDPALWWTHDLGEPALYELTVELCSGLERVDSWQAPVGVRTIELDQRPDPEEPGTRFFRFVLNGVGLFARGANWIPADSFVGAVPAERYRRLIADARDAHMNMLRVWGGGIYEHDLFYELCDRLGLLVWQDFMFSCAIYPEDARLAREVELEARYQVARLRNHASLALWCGNNENQWIHDRTFADNPVNRVGGQLYYDAILPGAVSDLDGRTPYWPGSPYGGSDHNGREDGDVHDWEAWHGNSPRRFGEPARREHTPESVAYTRYADDAGRFISEFGTLSAPDRETLRRWIPPEQLHHRSAALDHHTRDEPKDKIDMLLRSVTGVPRDLDELVDFSTIAQAEAMKFGVEHFRRRKPHCSGTLIWQLNDCWPVLSWSLIDYEGFGKPAYWFARRFYAPVLASFRRDPEGGVELWLTNDTVRPVDDVAIVRLARFAGGAPLAAFEVAAEVPPHASRALRRFEPEELPAGPDRYLTVSAAGGSFARNRHFFAAIKDLERTPPRVRCDVEAVDRRELAVRLRADAYAYFVGVALGDPEARPTDNYLELEPGEERVISVRSDRGRLDPDRVRVRSR